MTDPSRAPSPPNPVAPPSDAPAAAIPTRRRSVTGPASFNRGSYTYYSLPVLVFKYWPMYGAQIAFRNYDPSAVRGTIDAERDAFIAQLNTLGLEQVNKVYQDAYDRYAANA